jgi:anti-sigma regulatory factor (Ser/Thr protein kinase)
VVGVSAGTDVTVTLRLPPSAVHVRTARLIAAAMARRCGIDEALLDEVRLAVGEACARAVRQHERHGLTDPVTVEFAESERFEVAVVDRAQLRADNGASAAGPGGMGAVRAEVPPWTDPSGDALGLALLSAVVQDLEVAAELDGTGTRVTMSWPVG